MNVSTPINRIVKSIALGLTLAAIAAPQALAVDDYFRDDHLDATPSADVFERAVQAQLAESGPQAVAVDDYFREAHLNASQADVLQRAMQAQLAEQAKLAPKHVSVAFPRDDYAKTVAVSLSYPRDDYARVASPPIAATSGGGMAWGDFGIGAGSMLGALALLAGLGALILATRHGRQHELGT
jgi:hypothetical protein